MDRRRAIDALRRIGFSDAEQQGQDLRFTRPSDVGELFERVELIFAGRRFEVVHPSIAISVVSSPYMGPKDLVIRAGLDEMHVRQGDSKVEFSSVAEENAWIERLAVVGPRKVAELAKSEGPKLLTDTRDLRESAKRLYQVYVEHWVKTKASVAEQLTPEQLKDVHEILRLRWVLIPELPEETMLAVAALVIDGAPGIGETQDIFGSGRTRSQSPPPRIRNLIYLLADLQVRDNSTRPLL